MTTQEIANRLVELCRTGDYEAVYQELFHPDVLSVEPAHSPMPEARGLDALREKGRQFNEGVQEMHGGYTSDALVAGNHITLTMGMDVTMKDGNRTKMDEVCVYEVKDGKIVKEQFFF
ncbi:MAG: nuclear transport factor 2 family protein [Saprospirales bacterium]|nr:nuclear transport factor 2 family protein [Saprospirales bacterium]MBK8490609.1 nuclear transport factor 2 family protein [Saprospirales bacterium]